MNKTLNLFRKKSFLNWDLYKPHEFSDAYELENFARIGNDLYMKTQILWTPKNPKFFKCKFLIGREYTECTIFSKGLHVLTMQELKNIENFINEKLYCIN